MRTKKLVRTVNKGKPVVEFTLWHSNENGYCPVANREIIGIINARFIVKKVLNITAKQVEMVINKIQEEKNYIVFGKDIEPYFESKIKKLPNVFFLGAN